MPDLVTHYYFGQRVIESLPEDIAGIINIPIYEQAIQGPDAWSYIGFYGGKNKKFSDRSSIMHEVKTGEFLCSLTNTAKNFPDAPVFSVLAGMICHYCLDKQAHPYIIGKGGTYDGTPETEMYKSGHLRLERAIDSYVIRNIYNTTPWKMPLAKRCAQLKKYPESLRGAFDMVYKDVYGWENGFDSLNDSLRDAGLFYMLVQDPFGIVKLLLRPLSRGKTNYSMFSYYHREVDHKKVDFLNNERKIWRNPFEPTIESTDSFFDLFEGAVVEAVQMIGAAYEVIANASEMPLTEIFGNSSYTSGLECGKYDKSQKLYCEPINYDAH